MMPLKKTFTAISIIINLISCSKEDISNLSNSDNLDFTVFTQTYDPYLFQINVTESGEMSESNLTTELGLKTINTFKSPFPLHSKGNFFVFKEPDVLHIKNISTNNYKSIHTICNINISSGYSLYKIGSTDNKFVLLLQSKGGHTILTIDKNLDINNCQQSFLIKETSFDIFDDFHNGSKHVIFIKHTKDNTYIYSYNTELNQLNRILYNQLTDNNFPKIIMSKNKFYLFETEVYKTFDYEFNLLEEDISYNSDFDGGGIIPVEGSQIEFNKMKVDFFKFFNSGFSIWPNAYDLINNTILVNQEAVIKRINDNIGGIGTIRTYEIDLKKNRIIYGIDLYDSINRGKILITDFDSNVLDEIFINSVPIKIHIL